MFGTGLGHYLPLFLYLVCIAGSIACMIQPRYGVYILAFILPLNNARMRLTDYPLGGHVVDLILLGVIAGAIFSNQSLFPPKQLRGTIAALCVVLYVSLWVGGALSPVVPLPIRTGFPDGSHTPFGYWLLFMRLPAMYVAVCASIKNRRQMEILLFVMMLAFLWNAKNFYGNVGHRDMSQFSNELRNSMGGDFGGSNGRAAYAAACTLFLIAFMGTIASVRVRIVAGVLIAAGLYCVLFAYSRGAYAAFVLGLIYLACVRLRWLIPVLLLAGLFAGALLPSSVIQRVQMTYTEGELDNSSAERLQLWKIALEVAAKDPILGVGFDCFHLYLAGRTLQDTHNLYLKALAETGVIGLGCVLALFFSAFAAGHRLCRKSANSFDRALGAGFAAVMISVIVTNIFGDRWTLNDTSANTWILMAMVTLASEWNRQAAAVPVPPRRSEVRLAAPRVSAVAYR